MSSSSGGSDNPTSNDNGTSAAPRRTPVSERTREDPDPSRASSPRRTRDDAHPSGATVDELTDPFSDHASGSWFLLRTRSRQEKLIASDFAARGVTHYLPLMNRVRTYGRRKIETDVPVFPGYVFLRGNADDAYSADRAGRLAQIITVKDQKRLNEELRNIWFALTKNARLSHYPFFKRGVKVEVRSGPFQGLCGVIEDWTKRHRLILQVEILGRSVSLEVDGALLDVVH